MTLASKMPFVRKGGAPLGADGPRARRMAERVRTSREAMAAARPFNSAIADLTAQIAALRVAVAWRGRDDDLAHEAGALARAVYRQQVAFADATVGLTSLAEHDERIGDTRSALDDVSVAIELIRKTLARPEPHVRDPRPPGTAYVPAKFNR